MNISHSNSSQIHPAVQASPQLHHILTLTPLSIPKLFSPHNPPPPNLTLERDPEAPRQPLSPSSRASTPVDPGPPSPSSASPTPQTTHSTPIHPNQPLRHHQPDPPPLAQHDARPPTAPRLLLQLVAGRRPRGDAAHAASRRGTGPAGRQSVRTGSGSGPGARDGCGEENRARTRTSTSAQTSTREGEGGGERGEQGERRGGEEGRGWEEGRCASPIHSLPKFKSRTLTRPSHSQPRNRPRPPPRPGRPPKTRPSTPCGNAATRGG